MLKTSVMIIMGMNWVWTLEYEVDEEVEFAEIQLDIKKIKKIVV